MSRIVRIIFIPLIALSDDLHQAGPTSADGTPSLAAVVASIDSDFVQFPCSMELQKSKEEVRALSSGFVFAYSRGRR